MADVAIRLLTAVTGFSTTARLRLGVDACDVAILRKQLTLPTADHFLATRFTDAEREYCQGRADRLAARWAAKEAVAKAVGTGFRGLTPGQIEIARRPNGAPYVQAVGAKPWPGGANRWQWAISLAHENDLAIAAAVALTDEVATDMSRPAAQDVRRGEHNECRRTQQ
jgi:holo-[acyl-carrier protein] synthase